MNVTVKESEDLGLYLGMPLSHQRPRKKDVQMVIDKLRKKLANWKTNFLSKAGRLVLIKSTLNTLPTYYMQTTFLPRSTLKEMDKICNDFFMG